MPRLKLFRSKVIKGFQFESIAGLQRRHVPLGLVAISAQGFVPVKGVCVRPEFVTIGLIIAGYIVLPLEQQNTSKPVALLLKAHLIAIKQGLILAIPRKNVFDMKSVFGSRLRD